MAKLFYASSVRVPPDVAWDLIDRYLHSKVRAFSASVSQRPQGEFRVVPMTEASEIQERNLSVDADRMCAVYTVPGLLGTKHHQAEMRVVPQDDGGARVEWTTEIVPHELADVLRKPYAAMFDELVTAMNGRPIQGA